MSLRERFPGLTDARLLVAAALAAALAVPAAITVSEWAEKERVVPAETGSSHPGKWHNALTPYLVEPMNCLSSADPCSDVTLKFSAQSGKSEVGVNWVG